ncbi:DUF455 family protein [Fluviispira vulneris]|uniref:DUF455 family protein n=1 Tax=Fluviispira vulneris TaxID=2763012 RepID=UPI0016449716|nr:DUF455 family protein [Fluviispira vulneris]
MELKEFAEIILFGTNIAHDKLLEPKLLTDDISYQAIIAPKFPGRPNHLCFEKMKLKKKLPFPNNEQLKSEQQRGFVLHFFANHELLAMEIMALVLLKFPNAPKSFRMGIARTILEEQKHMSLYLNRMQELNVEFGEIPVNDFFWNCLSQMQSPLDFVTQMSMTFEQANIDYSLYYKDLMLKINDLKTANILDIVYKEEIGHLKHGVTWFERMRDPAQSQWDAYVSSLKLPLSPARAKGTIYDREGRKLAGLSDDYINELSIYSSSKGRPPHIFYFNPACEAEVARGKIGFSSNKYVKNLQHDCSSLMLYIATKDDIILTPEKPSIEFLQSLKDCGFDLPEWYDDSQQSFKSDKIPQHYYGSLNPWGWSPESIHLFKPFKKKLIGNNPFQNNIFANEYFTSKVKPLYSKCFAAEISQKINTQFSDMQDILPTAVTLGRVVHTLEETQNAIADIFYLNEYSMCVLKAPFGSSGQNMRRIKSTKLDKSEISWIKRLLKEQDSLVVEPWFNKAIEFSYQFKIDGEKISLLGLSRFLTDLRGQYKATFVGRKSDELDENLVKFMYNPVNGYKDILTFFKCVAEFVAEQLKNAKYEGPAGIDAFIYSDKNSKYGFRFKVLSEINPRYTMGRVALEISKRIQSGAFAVWAHIRIEDILKNGFHSLEDFTTQIHNKFPVIKKDGLKPLIKEGILFTNDPKSAKFVLTTLIVGKTVLQEFMSFSGLKILQ